MNRVCRQCWLGIALAFALTAPAVAQDQNVMFAAADLEQKLKSDVFEIIDRRGSRFEQDRTQRVALQFGDSTRLLAKWAKAAAGGEVFNNVPRYEVAAYELQKLFLDEPDYVVPPTVMRVFPLSYYRTLDPNVKSTFGGNTDGVVVVLQYWLNHVTPTGVLDERRARQDDGYAYHFANSNVFSYLVRHRDSNTGNFLISRDSANPRIFAVDNGVTFASESGDRGTEWEQLRAKRLPAKTVAKLRLLEKQDLEHALSTLAQFEIREGRLEPVPPTATINPKRGVRRSNTTVQFGLTDFEIGELYDRLKRLLNMVDNGKLQTF